MGIHLLCASLQAGSLDGMSAMPPRGPSVSRPVEEILLPLDARLVRSKVARSSKTRGALPGIGMKHHRDQFE